MRLILLMMFLVGCQGGLNGRQDLVQSGKSTTEVVLRFEFLTQLQTLCTMNTIRSDYVDEAHYQQAVSSCVFNHLNGAGIAEQDVISFQEQYCKEDVPPGATVEQLAALADTCKLFTQ